MAALFVDARTSEIPDRGVRARPPLQQRIGAGDTARQVQSSRLCQTPQEHEGRQRNRSNAESLLPEIGQQGRRVRWRAVGRIQLSRFGSGDERKVPILFHLDVRLRHVGESFAGNQNISVSQRKSFYYHFREISDRLNWHKSLSTVSEIVWGRRHHRTESFRRGSAAVGYEYGSQTFGQQKQEQGTQTGSRSNGKERQRKEAEDGTEQGLVQNRPETADVGRAGLEQSHEETVQSQHRWRSQRQRSFQVAFHNVRESSQSNQRTLGDLQPALELNQLSTINVFRITWLCTSSDTRIMLHIYSHNLFWCCRGDHFAVIPSNLTGKSDHFAVIPSNLTEKSDHFAVIPRWSMDFDFSNFLIH